MASPALAVRPGAEATHAPPKQPVLWAIALGGCCAAVSSFALALSSDEIHGELGEPLAIAVLLNWITLSYVLGGLLAWSRRPASRFGPLMLVVGFVNFASTLSWTSYDPTFTFGQALNLLPPVLFLHICLAFPTGRVQGRFERTLIAAAYATAVGLQFVRMSVSDFGPHNLLELTRDPSAALWATRVQLLGVSAFCLCGIGVLAARRRRAGRPLRRSLALLIDAFALGLVMIALLFLSILLEGPAIQQIRWATLATFGVAPIAFVIGLLHERLARAGLGHLFVELRADPGPADLQGALARALRDPSLTLAYWLPEFRSWADLDGRSLELPAAGSGRAATLIDRDGAPAAALVHDPALADEPELLDAVTAAAGIALENGRLQVELRARLEELRGSRLRILDAGQEERKRLERNLHDGAQQRLVALALELSLLEERLNADPDSSARVGQARREVAASLEELREIAHGIHPAVVSAHGLAVALERLATRAPVPVSLTVDVDGRLPEPLEVAAYYLVAESLANVGKYAQASSVTVEVTRGEGRIVVEIADDGIGGADTERGSGLRGLADRVEALDGRLQVWSPRGGGTRVRAEIPCAR